MSPAGLERTPARPRAGAVSRGAGAAVDLPLVFAWLVVLGFGLVMVASASVSMDRAYLARHGVSLAIALAAFLAVLAMPLALWRHCRQLAWVAALALCVAVLVPGIGQTVNGATRWIDLGVATFQPSEAARFLLLVYLAGFLARNDEALQQDSRVLVRPLFMLGLILALLVAEPDIGSVVVLGSTAGALLFLAGTRLRYFVPLVLLGAALFTLLAVAQPYRLERLVTFTDPWATAYGSGYQLVQALIAFGRGELLGLGLGAGIQKLYYLPEAHNDFIFAVIAEELGLVGALAVLALFGFLVYRILAIGKGLLEGGSKFGGYLCYGVGIMLGVQALINLGVTSGILPTKGLTLPFVSYGGNSLIVCCALIALVFRAQLEESRA